MSNSKQKQNGTTTAEESTEELESSEGEITTFSELEPKAALKRLSSIIKEYENYNTVPSRRKTDFHFRQYLSNHLTQTADKMKEIHAYLIERQQMSTWAIGERLINEISNFCRNVKEGDFGFTTLFENPKLLEIDISQLYFVDLELIDVLETIRERTLAFLEIVQRGYFEDIDLWFETLDRLVGRILKLYDDRLKLIGSYERISY